MQSETLFEIYTDGSCIQEKGYGSWAFVILSGGVTIAEASGFEPKTTSNRTEFQAAIEALKRISPGSHAIVFTDSRVVVDTMTLWLEDWRKLGWVKATGRPIPSIDQIKALDELCRARHIRFKWIKAHAGNPMNEYCDRLCIEARNAKISKQSKAKARSNLGFSPSL